MISYGTKVPDKTRGNKRENLKASCIPDFQRRALEMCELEKYLSSNVMF
jgi:hypothetical protein